MFTLKTPAKINWLLLILGKREDGYHEISSLMQFVGLYDYLTFEQSDGINIITDAGIPLEENLVYKAAKLLKEELSVRTGVTITLKKNIPVSAGLGGGSSDAACALAGLNKLWGLGLDAEKLMEFGGRLGSDIPFFLNGPFAEVSGRGEIVKTLKSRVSYALLLVKPDIGVSTKWAYAEYSRLRQQLTKKDNNIKLFTQALDKQDFTSIADMIKNDLEIPVMRRYQVIAGIKDRLLECGARASLMSGSGPTVFGVFDSAVAAERASVVIKPPGPGEWCKVVETII